MYEMMDLIKKKCRHKAIVRRIKFQGAVLAVFNNGILKKFQVSTPTVNLLT